MSDTSFVIDASEVRGWATAAKKAPQVFRDESRKAVNAVSAQGAAFAIAGAPRDAGTLAASITPTAARIEGTSIVGGWNANAVHAAQKEFGGPIFPKYKKLLSWIDKNSGERVFAKMVVQKAQPYMRPARDRVKPLIPAALRKAARRAIDGLAS